MTRDSLELIMAIVAVIIGGAALTVGSFALAIVVGIKNSTHQVVWKPLEEPKADEADVFGTVAEELDNVLNNPNKKFKNETPTEDPEFADLSDASVTSNKW